MKAAILTIGDELLNGQTIDTNSAWIGIELAKVGVEVAAKMSVSDQDESIRMGLDVLYKSAAVVLVTGGLGPTQDDVTKKSLAKYFEDELVFSNETYDRLSNMFEKRGRKPLEAHRQQCMLPNTAELIINKRGTAPGMWMQKGGKYLLSMPGVPAEMKGIMTDGGLDIIAKLNPDIHIDYRIIKTAGIGESMIAERIADILKSLPAYQSIAYLPGRASVKLRLTAIGSDAAQIESDNDQVAFQIKEILGDFVYASGDHTLQEVVGQLALQKGWMIGTAESCTGGHIAQLITSISGSSRYYKGSVIAYANEIKTDILNVASASLEQHGAVSEQVVEEMISGLLAHLNLDVGIAVSGIAGPTGGTPQKPVGTIWIAVGDRNRTETKKLSLSKDRQLNIEYTAIYALDMLRRFLMN